MSTGNEAEANPVVRSRLWWWFVAVCVLQLGAWTAWIAVASQHKVAEVPLANSR